MAAAPGEAGKAAAELAGDVLDRHSTAPSSLQTQLNLSAPQPLGNKTRSVLERYFKHDLSMVRVHTGPTVQRMSNALRADAFTVGSHIYLRSSETLNEDPASVAKIGHEVSHMFHQSSQPVQRAYQTRPVDRRFIQRQDYDDDGSNSSDDFGMSQSDPTDPDYQGMDPFAGINAQAGNKIDVEELADQIYKRMKEDLEQEFWFKP